MKPRLLLAVALIATTMAASAGDFIHTNGTHFVKHGEPYYFVGTNLWYAPILASTGRGGDRHRLALELDSLQAMGINNLRILVGADSGSDYANSVKPYLQPEPGVLNDTLLDGLDYLLAELERRDMEGIFYLNNSWDWSGGFGFYLKNTGHGHSPNANGDGYDDYCRYAAQFSTDSEAQELFYSFVRSIVGRTNRYTGQPYSQSPAIMAWQICNEPRPFASENKEAFAQWVLTTARIIKEIDPNHMVSLGSEGQYGCHYDWQLYTSLHSGTEIDYLTLHLWPINWGWGRRDDLAGSLPDIYRAAGRYIGEHAEVARVLNRPMVIEEFGYPRDETSYTVGSPVCARDQLYTYVFSLLRESHSAAGPIAGVNFWGWGGLGRPDSTVWKAGDDFICDPPHEPQGWYSVFSTDRSTISLIRQTATAVSE